MDNKFDDLENNQDQEETNSDVEELIKELENTLNEFSDDENHQHKKPIIKIVNLRPKMFKNIFLEFLYELAISFILIWSINVFFKAIQTNTLGLGLFVLIYMIIDYSFNDFLYRKKPIFFIVTLGGIGGLISILAFLASGIISLQLVTIEFTNFGICLLLVIAFLIIRKIIFKYFLKLKYLQKRKGQSK